MRLIPRVIAGAIAASALGTIAATSVPASPPKPSPAIVLDQHRFAILQPLQRKTVEIYLAKHRNLRPAVDADCACAEDLALQRTPEADQGAFASKDRRAGYDPYLAIGDFNMDGVSDFAIMFVDSAAPEKDKPGVLAIFNGPFSASANSPAYQETADSVKQVALFHSVAPPGHLIIGIFQSEGCLFNASGRGYVRNCEGA